MSYADLYDKHVTSGILERGQAASALTGTVAATADGTLWTFRYPETAPMPSASRGQGKRLSIQNMHVEWTTLTAFTAGSTPTVGRGLRLVRGAPTSGTASNPSGGAAFTAVRKRSSAPSPGVDETLGVGRIATTAVLTTTGITFESNVIKRLTLAGNGTAGSQKSADWAFFHDSDPLFLLPGELIAIQTDQAMDAAGTFQLSVDVDACEIVGV